jgi:hypothetical protein
MEALAKFPKYETCAGGSDLDKEIKKYGSLEAVKKAYINGKAFYAVEPGASEEQIQTALLDAISRDRPLLVKLAGNWRAVKLQPYDGCFD